MKDNNVFAGLVGWGIIAGAYILGRKHGKDRVVAVVDKLLLNAYIEEDEKRKEEVKIEEA